MDTDYIPVWLNKPVPRLEHRAPADVLAAGGYEQISGAVGELEYPTFSCSWPPRPPGSR